MARSSGVKLVPFGVVQVGINAVVIGTIPQVSIYIMVDSSRVGSICVGYWLVTLVELKIL